MRKTTLSTLAMLLALTLVGCGVQPNSNVKVVMQEPVVSSASSDEINTVIEVDVTEEDKIEEKISEGNDTEEIEAEGNEAEETLSDGTITDDIKTEEIQTVEGLEDSGELMVPSNSGRLHVEGSLIKNEKGQTVQLKGISTHGIAWFPGYVNNSLFKELRQDWNCNVIRLAMYTEEYGGYVSGGNKSDLKKLINDGVKYATDNDMYVIIDWHILSDGNPNKNIEESKKFFAEISALYKNNNNVIYEICNEPNGGVEWSEIKSYAETVIPVIRENDKNSIILVGTPTWSQEVDKAAENPITGYDNIMYTLHFYAATHKEELREKLEKAVRSGIAVFVSEYGVCDASGSGAIDYVEAAKWMELLNEYKISSCAWNLSNKSETSAIFGNFTSKTSGFRNKDLSASGKWLYNMLTGKETFEPSSNEEENTILQTEEVSSTDTATILTENAETKKYVQGDLDIYLKPVNSWDGSEGKCFQYELTILNNGNDVSNWQVEIEMDSAPTLINGWCAKYSVSGNKMTITNESYNGEIKKGCTTKDIGFIVAY